MKRAIIILSVITFFTTCKEGDIIDESARNFSRSEAKEFSVIQSKSFAELRAFILANEKSLVFKSQSSGFAHLTINGSEQVFTYITCFDLTYEDATGSLNLKYLVANNERPVTDQLDDLTGISTLFYGIGVNVFESGVYRNRVVAAYYLVDEALEVRAESRLKRFDILTDGLYSLSFDNIDAVLFDLRNFETLETGYKISGLITCQ